MERLISLPKVGSTPNFLKNLVFLESDFLPSLPHPASALHPLIQPLILSVSMAAILPCQPEVVTPASVPSSLVLVLYLLLPALALSRAFGCHSWRRQNTLQLLSLDSIWENCDIHKI